MGSPDGLRGIAAILVVLHHASLAWFSWDIHWGWSPALPQTGWFIRLPIIRLLLAGPPQVAVFFVVSGFAISYKPLKLARQGRFAEVGSALFSSVFRRHPRLFMPAFIITLFSALIIQADPFWYTTPGLPGVAVPNRIPPHALSLRDQLVHFVLNQVVHTSPIKEGLPQGNFTLIAVNPYDPNLWTLPMEFSSSMVVFLFIGAFTEIHSRIRMVFAFFFMLYIQYYFVFWAIFMFLGGMLVCDLHFEIDSILAKLDQNTATGGNSPSSSHIVPIWALQVPQSIVHRTLNRIRHSRLLSRSLAYLGLFVSLWLLSTPEWIRGAQQSWGYVTLTSWVPGRINDSALVPIGAIILVFTIDRAKFLQPVFMHPVSQYFARISFSLYLVHGPLLWSAGLKLAHMCLGVTGWATNEAYTFGIFLAACLWWPLAVYVADLTAVHVDENCVRFTRWLYQKLLVKKGTPT